MTAANWEEVNEIVENVVMNDECDTFSLDSENHGCEFFWFFHLCKKQFLTNTEIYSSIEPPKLKRELLKSN